MTSHSYSHSGDQTGHSHDGHSHGDHQRGTGRSAGGHSHAHDHDAGVAADHGHTHEVLEHPVVFEEREKPITGRARNYAERAYTARWVKETALMLALCRKLRDKYSIVCVTNDIFTKEDTEFLVRNDALPAERIRAIETGGCPHAAIREDISANLNALEQLHARFLPQLLLIESGGDNLAANYSRELADYIIYVIDVAGGDKVPRKGGPGITQSDLLVINKTDLAPAVGADLDVMKRDSFKMRGTGPTVFAQVKHDVAVDDTVDRVLAGWRESGAASA